MRLQSLWTLTLGWGLSNAFKDTSPFFFSSTSELLTPSSNLVSGSTLHVEIARQLERCPSETYIIVLQPGVTAAEYKDKLVTPRLSQLVSGSDKAVRSSLAISDVRGTINTDDLSALLQSKCDAENVRIDASTSTQEAGSHALAAGAFSIQGNNKPRVINVAFPYLPFGHDRLEKLAEHGMPQEPVAQEGANIEKDAYLASILSFMPSPKYTVIYTTTPNTGVVKHTHGDSQLYEMDSLFQSTAHVDLKRDLRNQKRDANVSLPEGPLFERYQFLTPGLFMGILAGIILLSILYIALSGISNLQVTYAAFDRETGPAAQKNKAQ
ncbi:uncharacterized protein KY384_008927 [Bacidia gigantensis]|uniref:uncharacterized protein n=1 Tax=Bacidia gigantensis TaxID=2732470 RepID=UPI001D047B3E|nr:uncharacterized protein KY384_008927 [Bacidia gigantensis]KAG8525283.1 hypothetical protein KY384_008927 [Bacidia gigantensis]